MADPIAKLPDGPPTRQYSGVERAAVLMMLVGDDEAAAILQKLDPEEVRQLGKAMFAVADVSEIEVEDVLDDFVDKARERTAIGFDPRPRIEGMMTRALGAEKAESVLARITPPQ
ncbi:MAG: flagellar motor switch protein FliG, partial [Sphingomonas sp.]|nr:flagellar motor switch protein FliG [Sphingomonas sp.]